MSNIQDASVDREAQLVDGCRKGETSAFETLYSMHQRKMKSLAFNYLHDRGEAEDAVQETFLKIYRSAGDFRGGSAATTWMYRILVNTCLDLIRKRTRRSEESATVADDEIARDHVDRSTSEPSLRATLRALIGELSEVKRSVFLFYEVEGFSHREISAILDINEGYSKWLLFEAKRELKKRLGNRDPGT